MKTISEFIMEQETGYSYDDNYELDSAYIKEFAEYEVATSILNCYYEQLALLEFAEENGIYSLSVITEADEVKKDGILKKIGGGIKDAFTKLIELIKTLVGKIVGFFTNRDARKKAKDLKEQINEISNTGTTYDGKPVTSSTPVSDIVWTDNRGNKNDSKDTESNKRKSDDRFTLTVAEVRYALLLSDIKESFSNINMGLKIIEDACSTGRIERNKSGLDYLDKSYKDIKDVANYHHKDESHITFGEFEAYVYSMEDNIKAINKYKSSIQSLGNKINSFVRTNKDSEKPELITFIKTESTRLNTEYKKLVQAYENLLKIYKNQKADSEEQIRLRKEYNDKNKK